MLLIYVILLFFAFTAISEVKECIRKAAKKREREEEREIIRKIKADHMKGKSKDDLDTEFGKKYNIVIGGWQINENNRVQWSADRTGF